MSGFKDHDHYRLLGVDPRASTREIHRAYRDLARRFHPDVTGDEATMKLMNIAWHELRDGGRRAEYDRDRNQRQTTIASGSGPAARKPSGTVLTYGRYAGWSPGQIADVDPAYLEWLQEAPGYRWLRAEINAALAAVEPARGVREGDRPQPRGKFARFAGALRG